MSDIQIRIEGDQATAESRFLATHLLRGVAAGETWTLAGRYTHQLRRGPDGWKVTALRMEPGESTGNPELLAEAQRRVAQSQQQTQ